MSTEKEDSLRRFEAWFKMNYPLFREDKGRDTTLKHRLWTAWQAALVGDVR